MKRSSKSLLITALLGFVPGASLSALQAPLRHEEGQDLAQIRRAIDARFG